MHASIEPPGQFDVFPFFEVFGRDGLLFEPAAADDFLPADELDGLRCCCFLDPVPLRRFVPPDVPEDLLPLAPGLFLAGLLLINPWASSSPVISSCASSKGKRPP